MRSFINGVIFTVLLGLVGAIAFIYSGIYPIGADDHHTVPVHWALETLRDRSVAVRAAEIKVPSLDDPLQLLAGGADYNDMCAGCHLKPGRSSSDLDIGMYPSPPDLAGVDEAAERLNHSAAQRAQDAAEQFWIIKHGIKASGMPAWGLTHEDERIWAMVAFLQRLPELTPEQYRILTVREQ